MSVIPDHHLHLGHASVPPLQDLSPHPYTGNIYVIGSVT